MDIGIIMKIIFGVVVILMLPGIYFNVRDDLANKKALQAAKRASKANSVDSSGDLDDSGGER